ncbi:MAG: hypothetical protein NT007_00295 [Candidatus Kapabacteria bacterium]|nr:hypothetical protein [Candidatus Kapabacteria bacterium]
MEEQAIKIKFSVNGVEANSIGYSFEFCVEEFIPDIPENSEIFQQLTKSKHYRTRYLLAHKKNLNRETIIKLMNDNDYSVVEAILQHDKIACLLTEDYVENIFSGKSELAIEPLIDKINYFEMNEKVKKLIIEKSKIHLSPNIRESLIDKCKFDKDILTFMENDEDADVAKTAKYLKKLMKSEESFE